MQRSISMRLIANNLLVDLLRIAVWRESHLYRSGLIYRQMLCRWLTIDGAGTGEDDMLNAMCLHLFEEGNQRHEVITIIEEWLLHGFTYCLAGCKVNHSLNICITIHHVGQSRSIIAVHLFKVGLLTHNSSYTIQHILVGIAQVIHNDYIVALLYEFDHRMRTDISCTACY